VSVGGNMMKNIDDLPMLSGSTWTGHAAEFRRGPTDIFVRAQKEVGEIGAFKLFNFPAVMVFGPDLVHELLVEKQKKLFKSLAIKIMFYPMAGRGLFTADGDLWRRQRKLIAPLFQPQAIRSYATMMNDVITRCLNTWKEGDVIDAGREMTRITMGVAAKTLFDADTLDESDDISDAIHAMFNYITDQTASVSVTARAILAGTLLEAIDLPPSIAKIRDGVVDVLHHALPIPSPERLRLFKGLRLLDDRIQRMTDERRRTGTNRDDLLSRLLTARDEDDGSFMTDRQVRDEAMTLFIAGHETTATSTTWSLYFLSRNPDAYRRWQDELAALGGQPLSPDNTSKLPWTRGVFREALRFYPPAFAVDRVAMEEVEIGGYSFPRLTPFVVPIHAIHRNPALWPDPECFDPGRFAPELEAKRSRTAYLPFGIGPRVCIGATFAELEALLLLGQIAQRFEFEPVDTAHVGPDLRTALRPDKPILLRIKKIAK
jgi:cytochrome P450